MSNQPTDPQAGEPIDDLDVPAWKAESVTGGYDWGDPAEDDPQAI